MSSSLSWGILSKSTSIETQPLPALENTSATIQGGTGSSYSRRHVVQRDEADQIMLLQLEQIEPSLRSICILIEYNWGSRRFSLHAESQNISVRTSGGRFRVADKYSLSLPRTRARFWYKRAISLSIFSEAFIVRSISFWIIGQRGWGSSNELWEQSHVWLFDDLQFLCKKIKNFRTWCDKEDGNDREGPARYTSEHQKRRHKTG